VRVVQPDVKQLPKLHEPDANVAAA
jgi:hypothetical protein